MSISVALSNAVSGLSAVSRSAELVSANVANSMTDGYGRREIELGAALVGGQGSGVNVLGVSRIVNETALGDRRLSDAALGYHETRAEFFSKIERVIGTPDESGSLSAHFERFDQSLIIAAGDPSSAIKLSGVLNSADALTNRMNQISDKLQIERQRADEKIGDMVNKLNGAFVDVDQLNRQIRHQLVSGGSAAALMDQRQVVIDEISSLIPIRSIPRDHGQIALITPNGTTLVDFRAASFEFEKTPIITPDQTLANGALSGLRILGSSSSSGTALESIAGGRLDAAFGLRDQEVPQLQSNLDALALDLAQRAVSADANLAPGMAGLFTDAGVYADVANVEGLSGRIVLNASADPGRGGDLWRIRDGVSAAIPGPVSDSTFLTGLSDGINASSQPVTGSFSVAGTFSRLVSDLISEVGQERQTSLARQSFQVARSEAFRDLQLEGGVDTDQEMQKLLLIEQSYAANAKVIQAVDEMLQSLLRI